MTSYPDNQPASPDDAQQRRCEISVIVPAYNAATTIGRCLKSILAQTWSGRYEVVVVDDGSTDETAAVVEGIAAQSPTPVRLVSQDNAGAGHARNTGTDRARADIVAFCDADDTWSPEMLAGCADAFEQSDVQAVLTGYTVDVKNTLREELLDDDTLRSIGRPVDRQKYLLDPAAALELYLSGVLIGIVDTLIIRKDALDSVGGFPEDYVAAEDLLLWLRMLRHLRIIYVQESLVLYHLRWDTRSRRDEEATRSCVVDIYERFAREESFEPRLARIVRRRVAAAHMAMAIYRWRGRGGWLGPGLRACIKSPTWRRLRTFASMFITRPPEGSDT